MNSTDFAPRGWKFVCAAMVLLSAGAAQAAGVAFVTNVKGDVMADSAKIGLMAELNRGQRISCAAECTVGVMYLQSGAEYVVKGPGEYLVGEKEVTAKIGVPPVVRNTQWRVSSQTLGQLAQTSAASVRTRGIEDRNSTANKPSSVANSQTYPVDTKVASLSPAFTWDAAGAKAPFEFVLQKTGTDKPLYKTKAQAAAVKLPASVKLAPDSEYSWSVSAAGSKLASGIFQTLPAAALALASQRKPGNKAEFTDWLMYAANLHELGATQEARAIWNKLAKERPDLPELAKMANASDQ